MLVASPKLLPEPITNDDELAEWIRSTPWIGFSEELPATRRFWFAATGSSHPTTLKLIAPDIRIAITAVEQGLGASLLPYDFCKESLLHNKLMEVAPRCALPASPPWVLSASKSTKRTVEKEQLLTTIVSLRHDQDRS